MQLRTAITVLLLLATTAWIMPDAAQAKVTQVGPTSFHKQFSVPRRIGSSDAFNNDDDNYATDDRHMKRQNRRAERQRERHAANEESRTASDKSATKKRQGRRDKSTTALERRMQQKAWESLGDAASTGVND